MAGGAEPRAGDPDPRATWAGRAAAAERAVRTRHLRRLAFLPGTRLARTRWPARAIVGYHWHYWWQAHLLDCLLDAQRRSPAEQRRRVVAALVRGIRLRNLTGWLNHYYDDIAWLGLALQRCAALAGVRRPRAERLIARRLVEGTGPGGGVRWRVGDDFVNVPATGPAAIFFARRGEPVRAAALTDWVLRHLLDPRTGLVADGARVDPDGSVRRLEPTTYTYCQGVVIGACVQLGTVTGEPRWFQEAERLVGAVAQHLTVDGVLQDRAPGGGDSGAGGGDGGLFPGILARYLALAARRGGCAEAGRLVRTAAEAAWRNRAVAHGGPVFGPCWSRPALPPAPGRPEADLSVQLSGWMVLEAAAAIAGRDG